MTDAALAVAPALRAMADRLHAELAMIAGEPVAFSLFVWAGHNVSYVANVSRADVLLMIKAMAANWEAGVPDGPLGAVQ